MCSNVYAYKNNKWKKDGPNLLVVAAMKASELNGVEIINEFIKSFDGLTGSEFYYF
ncbi:MAG: hypothetical protein ACLFQJ_09055 [Campylobacterales bacterium]